jgi:uncharacterized protein YggE
MFEKPIVFAAIFLAIAPTAHAQTTLNLSATGEADATPDQITATLTAQFSSASPVAAQDRVNAAMAAALAAAKATTNVAATTANYSVSQSQADNGNGPTIFNASEDLTLIEPAPNGTPNTEFSALLEKLQSHGLLLENFDGSLSPAASRRAMQTAIADAMGQITAQAKDVADALGEKIGRVTLVNLNNTAPEPVPMMPRQAMLAMAAAPVAAPANVTIQANVTATVELVSK